MREDFFVWPGQRDEARRFFQTSQNGGCAICGTSRRLVLDHEHSPIALIRGLLCPECNRGLGQFADDPARLARAITYLAEHNERNDSYRDTDLWHERVGWTPKIAETEGVAA